MKLTSNPRLPYQMSTERERLSAPQGKPLIVHIVVNIEYWPYDQPTPRSIVIPPHGKYHVPDLPNFCWSEYGNRCGMPRLLELFGSRKLPVSASINASVIDVYPSLAASIRDAGWEFIGHGIHQKSQGETSSDESTQIRGALDKLREFTGVAPRGWMSPGWSETYDTLDHLRENGIRYVTQWVVDDIPSWLRTKHGPMISLPYGLDLNDSVVYAIEKHSSAEMSLRVQQTIQCFEREIASTGQPKVLTLAMHPHLSGVPHRVPFLEAIIDTLLARDDTIFMAGSQIADWFSQQSTPPEFAS